MRLLLLCAAVLSLATSAFDADAAAKQASAFAPGVATYDDVVASLGPPSSETAAPDGSRSVIYVSVRSHVKAVTFVPIVGLFVGGAQSTTSTTNFTFGPDGRLLQSTNSASTIDCSTSVVLSVGGGCVKGGRGPAP
ncbi:MAG TPA: hypothetical protein VN814_19190 [Caulobacteraceae bacterium]|nr:hypothetical protein [Caulobacteraceae bacterium]